MMNFRDKKSKRTFAVVIVIVICLAMLIGLLSGLGGYMRG